MNLDGPAVMMRATEAVSQDEILILKSTIIQMTQAIQRYRHRITQKETAPIQIIQNQAIRIQVTQSQVSQVLNSAT